MQEPDPYLAADALALLRALNNRPLDVHQLAADLIDAPSLIRQRVSLLERSGHLIASVHDDGRQVWSLTDQGHDSIN